MKMNINISNNVKNFFLERFSDFYKMQADLKNETTKKHLFYHAKGVCKE
jgi:hypothetical protein